MRKKGLAAVLQAVVCEGAAAGRHTLSHRPVSRASLIFRTLEFAAVVALVRFLHVRQVHVLLVARGSRRSDPRWGAFDQACSLSSTEYVYFA
jgi:hypothetical protein